MCLPAAPTAQVILTTPATRPQPTPRRRPRRVRLAPSFTPAPARYYLISYDIPDDNRRAAVAKTLKGFGLRVQWSVFEALLANHELNALARALDRLIDPTEDAIFIAPIAERGQPTHPRLAVLRIRRTDYWLL